MPGTRDWRDIFRLPESSKRGLCAEDEAGELAFAHDMNKAGSFQLFDVMRQRGRAHAMGFM